MKLASQNLIEITFEFIVHANNGCVCVPCTSVIRVAVRLEVPVSAVQICLLVNANVHMCVCVCLAK